MSQTDSVAALYIETDKFEILFIISNIIFNDSRTPSHHWENI